MIKLDYTPPGPVASRFISSRAPVRLIMGPVGSGKTMACLFNMLIVGGQQARSPIDGVRYSKFAVIRDTYRNLNETTIPSWNTWFPQDFGKWSGAEPISHRLRVDRKNGTIDMLVEFIALGSNRVEDVMRGWEGTGAYLNEADRLPEDVLTYIMSRVGRYPSKVHGGPSWFGVWADMNPPDTGNWTYRRWVERKEDGHELYRQPSGFSAKAENLVNLPADYYERVAAGQPDWFVRRMVRAQWGYSREGKPVYPEFSDTGMVPGVPIKPVKGLPLIIGLDAGATPAAIIKQHMPNGQWRALDELVVPAEESMGPIGFGRVLARLLKKKYAGFEVSGYADPSAAYGAHDKEHGESTWIETVEAEAEIVIEPCETNQLYARLESVRRPMGIMIDGDTPGYLMSPTCVTLRKAYNSGYQYRRKQIPGETEYDNEPRKNHSSHIADADQYAHLGGGEYLEVIKRGSNRRNQRRQRTAVSDDNPGGSYGDRATTARQRFAKH